MPIARWCEPLVIRPYIGRFGIPNETLQNKIWDKSLLSDKAEIDFFFFFFTLVIILINFLTRISNKSRFAILRPRWYR